MDYCFSFGLSNHLIPLYSLPLSLLSPTFLDIVKTGYDMLLLVLLLSLLLPLILFSKNHNDIDTIHKADPITVRLCLPNERRTIGLLPATATSSQCYAFTKTTKFF